MSAGPRAGHRRRRRPARPVASSSHRPPARSFRSGPTTPSAACSRRCSRISAPATCCNTSPRGSPADGWHEVSVSVKKHAEIRHSGAQGLHGTRVKSAHRRHSGDTHCGTRGVWRSRLFQATGDVQVHDRARRSRRHRPRQERQLRSRPEGREHHHPTRTASRRRSSSSSWSRTTSACARARSPASIADQAQYGAHRVFVLLFDEAHLANDSLMRVKNGAEGFIRDMFSRGRRRRRLPQRRHVQGTADGRQGGAARRHPRGAAGVREPPGHPRAVPRVAAHPERSRRAAHRRRGARGDRRARRRRPARRIRPACASEGGARQRREPDPAEGAALRPAGAHDDGSARSRTSSRSRAAWPRFPAARPSSSCPRGSSSQDVAQRASRRSRRRRRAAASRSTRSTAAA